MPPPGRRLHRPPAARPAPRRLRDMGARVEGERWIEISRPPRRPQALRDLHGRAVGDGDRERADGGRADAGPDDDLERRLRAARPGPRAACWSKMGAQIDGIGSNVMTVHGRDRLGGAEHRICRRPHRGRQLHGARRGDRRRAADPRRRARRPDHDPPPVPPPRPAVDGRGRRRARPARAAARGPATTSATRSRRSTTAPGPRSRPT